MKNKIEAFQPLLSKGLCITEAIKNEINQTKINIDLINKTKNFKIKTKKSNIIKEDLKSDIHTTTCLTCILLVIMDVLSLIIMKNIFVMLLIKMKIVLYVRQILLGFS